MTHVENQADNHGLSRRKLLLGAGAGVTAAAAGYCLLPRLRPEKTPVFLAGNQRYDGPLEQTIADGLSAVGFDSAKVRGRKVLLKPNLVEPLRSAPHLTTHPAMIVAAAKYFRRLGAEVVVGDGPANMRDTEQALAESGLDEVLRSEKLSFLDVNFAETCVVPNRGGLSKLTSFTIPAELAAADLVVSMPKLKTHHWVGVSAAMKNFYGVLPGLIYGWPKNVLHFAGIEQTVVDINASLPPTIAIVDGILCMEGDGPLLGTPKPMGLIAVGLNLPALDATLVRLTGFEPARIPYLALANGRLGRIGEPFIRQCGERWEDLASPFAFLDVPHIRQMRNDEEDPPVMLRT